MQRSVLLAIAITAAFACVCVSASGSGTTRVRQALKLKHKFHAHALQANAQAQAHASAVAYNTFEHYRGASEIRVFSPDFSVHLPEHWGPAYQPTPNTNDPASPWALSGALVIDPSSQAKAKALDAFPFERDNKKVFGTTEWKIPLFVASTGDYWGVFKEDDRVCIPATADAKVRAKEADARTAKFKAAFESWFDGDHAPPGLRGILEGKIFAHETQFNAWLHAKPPRASNILAKYRKDAANWKGGLEFLVDRHTSKLTNRNDWDIGMAGAIALAVNDDHFTWCARDSFIAGFELAKSTAKEAGVAVAEHGTQINGKPTTFKETEPRRQLHRAYAMAAHACHYLTDLFSSGHFRTPRYEMRGICSSGDAAGLTTNVMHDEDNANGLYVTDGTGNGDKWWMFGDFHWFEKRNAVNRHKLHAALQATFDAVFGAFVDGYEQRLAGDGKEKPALTFNPPKVARPASADPLTLLPRFAGLPAADMNRNTCPLFARLKDPNSKSGDRKWYIRASRGAHFDPRPIVSSDAVRDALYHLPDDDAAPKTPNDAQLAQASASAGFGRCTFVPLTKDNCCNALGRSVPKPVTAASASSLLYPLYANTCKASQVVDTVKTWQYDDRLNKDAITVSVADLMDDPLVYV